MSGDAVQQCLASMVPRDVESAVAVPMEADVASLHPDERHLQERFGPKRRAEFATGRRLARQALRRLGIEAAALLPGEDRGPRWPAGAIGSISHTGTLCAVVVARGGRLASLGLDIEGADRVDRTLWDSLFTAAEQRFLESLSGDARTASATTLFSAKECFYKWQRPLTGRFLGPLEVDVVLSDPLSTTAGHFTVQPHDELPLPANTRLEGRWQRAEDHVVTLFAN